MEKDPEEIFQTVLKMREHLANNDNLEDIMKNFGHFKESCPRLFETVLANTEDYMPQLLEMVDYARRVKVGEASLGDVTKVVKNIYDKKYIFPAVSRGLTEEQLKQTQDFVRDQQEESDALENQWDKNRKDRMSNR